MKASQERPLEIFTCNLTIWIRPNLCVISLNTHILTADDTFLPQNLSREKAQVGSAHYFTALLAFTSPNLSELKTIWICFHRNFAPRCFICKAELPSSLRASLVNSHILSNISFSLQTQMKSKYHPFFTSNVTYPHLHILENKIVCSADSLLEG